MTVGRFILLRFECKLFCQCVIDEVACMSARTRKGIVLRFSLTANHTRSFPRKKSGEVLLTSSLITPNFEKQSPLRPKASFRRRSRYFSISVSVTRVLLEKTQPVSWKRKRLNAPESWLQNDVEFRVVSKNCGQRLPYCWQYGI
jgi:hypothetical protein